MGKEERKSVRISTANFDIAVTERGDPDSERLALVLPGLLDSKDYAHVREHTSYLPSLGRLAVAIDPPGLWESGGELNTYTASNYKLAINEIIDHYDRPTEIIGHSLGGRMGAVCAGENPKVDTFISIFSANTFVRPENKADRLHDWHSYGSREFTRDPPDTPDEVRVFKLPYSFSEDAQQYSCVESLAGFGGPKLFLAGRRDTIVPPKAVEFVFRNVYEPKSHGIVDAGHHYRFDRRAIGLVNQTIGRFLLGSANK